MKMQTAILVLIIFLGAFLRLYMLGGVPAGLTADEANSGYDAYSILKTGKDQWGELPLVAFRGFGDFRSPLYTFLIIPFIAFFDLTALSVRLPSAIVGVLGIIVVYFLGKKLFGMSAGLFAAFLFAVSPWSIGLSRQGLESNVAMILYMAGLYMFLKGKEDSRFIFASFPFFVMTMFTYTAYIFFTPVSLLFLGFHYKGLVKKQKRVFFIFAILFFIALTPFLINASTAGNARFSQVGFTNDITSLGLIDNLNQKIGSCQEYFSHNICRVFINKATLFSTIFFQNYLHHFSFDFLYISGTSTQYSLLPERGLFYMYEFILLLAGIVILLKGKIDKVILYLLLLAPVADALSGPGHHSRGSVVLPFFILIEAVGCDFLYKKMSKMLHAPVRNIIFGITISFIIFSFSAFFITYLSYFRIYHSSFSGYVYRELSTDLYQQKSAHNKIYVSRALNDTQHYIYYLFYNKYDPKKFQQKRDIIYAVQDNGFITVKKIDNIFFGMYRFDKQSLQVNKYDNKSLLVGNPKLFSQGTKFLKEYKELHGGVSYVSVLHNVE